MSQAIWNYLSGRLDAMEPEVGESIAMELIEYLTDGYVSDDKRREVVERIAEPALIREIEADLDTKPSV